MSRWSTYVAIGAVAYLANGFVVLLGISFGVDYVFKDNSAPDAPKPGYVQACSRFDGLHYLEIAKEGYSFDPARRSTVAFFPAYPLITRMITVATGWNAALSLLIVSNAMLLASFIFYAAYLRCRSPALDPRSQRLALLLFAFWPAAFFCRMSYSESTFLFFVLLFLCGVARSWPIFLVALLAGAATAARPVGLAVTAAFFYQLLTDQSRGSPERRVMLAVVLSPAACWGLLAYMGYQWAEFGDPLAFAQAQQHWTHGAYVDTGIGDKVDALLAFEPIWSAYVPGSLNHWARNSREDNFLFNLAFWNPLLFTLAFVLVLVGWASAWLTGPEVVLSLGLLLIPYATRAYEMSMASHARFAAIVLPAYIVLAKLLRKLPEGTEWVVLAALAALQMSWTALFAAGYSFF